MRGLRLGVAAGLIAWSVPAFAGASNTTESSRGLAAGFGRFERSEWGTGATSIARADASVLLSVARVVPPDADVLVHVEDAARLRARHGARPAAAAAIGFAEHGQVATVWTDLARGAGVAGLQLFDELLGERFTVVTRTRADRMSWAAILDVDRRVIGRHLDAWRAIRNLQTFGAATWTIPGADVRVMLMPDAVVLCGDRDRDLGVDITRRIMGFNGRVPRMPLQGAFGLPAAVNEASFADHPAVAAGQTLGRGSIVVVERDRAEVDERWSVHLIDGLDDAAASRLRLASVARMPDQPFRRPRTETSWSADLVNELAGDFIAVTAEPTDIGWGGSIAAISDMLGEPPLSAPLLDAIGDRRLLVFGEVVPDGARAGRFGDSTTPLPAAALVLEVRPLAAAGIETHLDLHMAKLVAGFGRAAGLDAGPTDGGPERAAIVPDRLATFHGTGHADVAPAVRAWWRGGPDAPGREPEPPAHLASAELAWGVARGPAGVFLVMASHDDHLDAVIDAVSSAAPVLDLADAGPWTSRGSVNGPRATLHLRGLADEAERFGPVAGEDDPVARLEAAAATDALRSMLILMADASRTMDRVVWRLARPDDSTIRFEMDVDLADPPTATVSRGTEGN